MRTKIQEKIPFVTVVLIAINVVTWLILEWAGDTQDSVFMLERGASYAPFILEQREWYRLFNSMFLHFGPDHLTNNMLMLGLLGIRLERVLGSVPFTVLYLFSGICGNLLSLYQDIRTGHFAVSAGASGAVFGIIGALLAWALLHKGKVEGLTTKGLLFMAGLSLYYGLSSSGIDNWGHIGGFIGGFLLGCLFGCISKMIDFKKRKQYTIE